MGYYTRHQLEVIKGDENLISELREYSEEARFSIESNGGLGEGCKWYEHQKDLKEFSMMHPNALFKLSGKGEESGDIWHEYYQNGKMQLCKAQIVFADFNADLLV